VGLFKRMARIGTPTHESLTRISKSLKFLRDNWESLTEASGVSGKKGRRTKARQARITEIKICVEWFRKKNILGARHVERKVAELPEFKLIKAAKLNRLHGDVYNRVLQKKTICIHTYRYKPRDKLIIII